MNNYIPGDWVQNGTIGDLFSSGARIKAENPLEKEGLRAGTPDKFGPMPGVSNDLTWIGCLLSLFPSPFKYINSKSDQVTIY